MVEITKVETVCDYTAFLWENKSQTFVSLRNVADPVASPRDLKVSLFVTNGKLAGVPPDVQVFVEVEIRGP